MLAAAGPFGLGPMELVIILLVLVLLFGATRLKDLGGSLGQGIKEFRTAVKEEDEAPQQTSTTHATETTSVRAAGVDGGEVLAVKCPSCGALNDAGAKHCNQCGSTIAAPVS